MSAEETLRKALTDLVDDYDGVEDMLPPECLQKILAARAALAIPPTVEQIEYRAAWDLYLRRTGHLIDPKWDLFKNLIDARLMLGHVAEESMESRLVEARNIRIESRAAAGPWLPHEDKS